MSIKLGVIMDPIATINPKKDSTLAMMLEAQARGWQLYYMEQHDLLLKGHELWARMHDILVHDRPDDWFALGESTVRACAELDVILMRKDPPFDMEYVYTTYLLEHAEAAGVLVVNKPRSLRDCNEKLHITWFPHCIAPTLVTRSAPEIRAFLQTHGDIILKPLDGMGGSSIFRLHATDHNIGVILETLSHYESRFVMAQKFIPEIRDGDKRIVLIHGEPIPYALARIPAPGETRGNLAAGGTGVGVALSERDRWLCAQVGPVLREKGLHFVGIDVIGDYLTEINVTSPTCIRELDAQYGLNISAQLMDHIEATLAHPSRRT